MRPDEVRQAMDRGATLLVPTQRAARAWRRRLFEANARIPPDVLPWSAWTARLWQDVLLNGHDERLLLNAPQASALWTEVLEEADPTTLLSIRAMVRLCAAAERLVFSHEAAGRLLRYHGEPGTDVAHFADWFRRLDERLRTDSLLPAAALETALTDHVVQAHIALPNGPLLLCGFDRLPPAQESLLAVLAQSGCTSETVDSASRPDAEAQGTLLRCGDGDEELAALCNAITGMLAGGNTDIPKAADDAVDGPGDAAFLLVVPDAEASRAALDRTLRSAFPGREHTAPIWEFAAGRPLSSQTMVADALLVLRWTTHALPRESVFQLLQSPYLDFGIDRERAGEVDVRTLQDSRRLQPEWSIDALIHRTQSGEPALHQQLQQVRAAAAEQTRGNHLHGEWAVRVRLVLDAAGWPGRRERTSAEFQLVDRWNDALDTLATVDRFNRPVSFSRYVADLAALAGDTLFAPENIGAPVQIVSPYEAAGTTADTLWFAHAARETWSARRTPSPLLPWHLQAEFSMPGTDLALDTEDHLRTTKRLLGSGRRVTASYAATITGNDTGDQRPAAVLDQFPQLRKATAALQQPTRTQPDLESFFDGVQLPLPAGSTVHGGVGVLQDQAACPFRAFASRRLFSTEPDSSTLGLDAREKGNLLHRALQLFWQTTGTQDNLLSLLANGSLDDELDRHIRDAAAAQKLPAATEGWRGAYLEVQYRRARRLLRRWLELEAARPAFRVQATEELHRDVRVGPLRLDLRVDRIDAIEQAGSTSLALIDYKTGIVKSSSWEGERPDEPQLPLYATHAGLDSVGAIAFASLRPGKDLKLCSLPKATELLCRDRADNDPEAFERQMEEWYATTGRLADEFAAGDAQVAPKEYPKTCAHCGQRMLCRLQPDLLRDTGDDETGTPEETAAWA